MGLLATVVYDIPRHTPLILRSANSSSPDVLDTVASFTAHCNSLRGIARSPTEVSALWGGPPHVSYTVVAARFRAIVIWDQRPAEFDLAADVHHALAALEAAVAKWDGSVADVHAVYEAAGNILDGGGGVVLPDGAHPIKKGSARQKLLPKTSAMARKSSTAESKSKKPAGGRLFNRIGSALKNVAGTPAPAPDTITNTPRSDADASSLRAPSEGAAASVASYASSAGAVFGERAELQLPDEVFAWAEFGQQSGAAEDLNWFVQLVHGEEGLRKRPRAPQLREGAVGSLQSTPLTIASSAPPLSKGAGSEVSSVTDSTKLLAVVPGDGSSGGLGSSSAQQSNVGDAAATMSRLSAPQSQSPQEGAMAGLANAEQSPGASSAAYGIASASPSVTQTASASLPPKQPQMAPSRAAQQQPSALPLLTAARGASTAMSMESGRFTAASSISGPPEPDRQTPPPSNVLMAANMVPPALAAQMQDTSDFNLETLGGYKDNAASDTGSGRGAQSGAPSQSTDDAGNDDAVRTRMNEFAVSMQAGNFTLALQQVYATLQLLRQIQPRRDRETVTCSDYVLAQKILIRNAQLEGELMRVPGGSPESVRRLIEMALLTMFLAELKHLLPRHRVAAMKVAIEKNMAVGNFGMCARWLRVLVGKAPPAQRAELEQRLQMCIARGEGNAQMPPTNRLCYITLQVLTVPYGKCNVCGAVYHAQMAGVVAGQVCPTCLVGAVEGKMQ